MWAGLALILLGLAVGWMVSRNRRVPVQVAPAVETVIGGRSTVLNASGYVTARRRATVSSKVTAKIVEVLVEEGMRVKSGEVLARLDASRTVRRKSPG